LREKVQANETQIHELTEKVKGLLLAVTDLVTKQNEIDGFQLSQTYESNTFQQVITTKVDKNLELIESTGDRIRQNISDLETKIVTVE